MTEALLTIEELSFEIKKREILKSLSFSLEEGEYLSIIGPNGAGKSTLLKLCNKILTGADGSIRLFGRDLSDYNQKELASLIAYVPQDSSGHVPFTVHEFIMMGRYPYLTPFSSPSRDDKKAVADVISFTGLESIKERTLDTLSGGERQKVFIAAALAQDAPILLLDEPTTFLDPPHQAEIFTILKDINDHKGVTIVSVMHDINNAVLTSRKIMALREGEIKYCGSAGGAVKEAILQEVYNKSFNFFSDPHTGKRLVVPEGAL